MKKITIWAVALVLVGAWWVWSTPPDGYVSNVDMDGEESAIPPEEGSLARELTEEEQVALDGLQQSAKENPLEVTISTSLGDIVVELFPGVAPETVDNFITLAGDGFYDGTTFHRVIQNFMIQGGDPNSKDDNPDNDGQGGPGYAFNDEINPHALDLSLDQIRAYEESGYQYVLDVPSLPVDVGYLAMANSGPNTNGSQFFIVTESMQAHLNGKHTVFGEVIDGMDIVRAIAAVETGSANRPVEDVVIETITLQPGV